MPMGLEKQCSAPVTNLVCVLALATPALADNTVPSGQPLKLYASEVVTQLEQGAVLYLGFLAPRIAAEEGAVDYEDAILDMDAICADIGLTMVAEKAAAGAPVKAVIIRLSDRPIAYGEANPEAAQFMGFYDISAGDCAWQ